MDIKNKVYNTEDNVARVAALPNEFGEAIEIIMDNMDKDWRNRLVHGKYIAYLCDMFEDGLKHGKSLQDLIGEDPVAFAREFQSKVDFRDLEDTPIQKEINRLLLYDFLILIGGYTMCSAGAKWLNGAFDTMGWVFFGLGVVCFLAVFVLKAKKYAKIKLPVWVLTLQIILLAGIYYAMHFSFNAAMIGFFACAAVDYFYGTLKAKVS